MGIGVDVVNVARFAATLRSVAGLHRLYFAPEELLTEDGQQRSAGSLAARYAVKEAVSKALGLPSGIKHADCRVVAGVSGEPTLQPTGSVATAAQRAGVTRWHVSLSVEGDVAVAMVVAESDHSAEGAQGQ